MLLPDVNVLVYAYREDATPQHLRSRQWLEDLANSDEPFGLSDLVLSSFIRIVTHPGIFPMPTPIDVAFAQAQDLRNQPNCVPLTPGNRHWQIFTRLCQETGARGKLVPDAYLAALAIESGSVWITWDGDYGRFDGLHWRRPL